MKYVLDSCVLIAFFKNEKSAAKVEQFLLKAKNKELELYLPIIQWGEILYIIQREYGQEKSDEVKFVLNNLPIKFIDITQELTEIAYKYKSRGGIAYPDCFVIAVASLLKGVVLTQDKEFKKFKEEINLEWL